MWPLISFLILIALLILVHESGHFFAAKMFGIKVKVFSLGFGKKLLKYKKNGTEYCLSMIPIGGYVKMEGEPFTKDQDEPQGCTPTSYKYRPAWQKGIVVSAGPLANIFLSMIVFSSVYLFSGDPLLKPIVGSVNQGGPAMVAGLMPGDKFLSINEQKIIRWEDLTSELQAIKSNPVKLDILRDGEIIGITVTPEPLNPGIESGEKERYIIGIRASMEYDFEKMSVLSAVKTGVGNTIKTTYLTAITAGQLITGGASLNKLNGPVRIAQLSERTARQGLIQFLFFLSIISTSLAVFNLIPIPVLDGGHLAFILVEGITGKYPSKRVVDISGRVGIMLISVIMAIALFNDIMGIF